MEYAKILQKLAENLKAVYQNTIYSQSSDKGDSREKAIIDYLTKVMPRKYGFQSGEVFDKTGNNSGQVDVIIYDNLFSTIFTDGTDKVLAPVESTYGIVSVKSLMGTNELDLAIDGIKNYDNLIRPKTEPGNVYVMPDFAFKAGLNINFSATMQQNVNCIFAYDTNIANQTIINKIRESECIDLLVVPGRFCAIGRWRSEFGLNKDSQQMSNYILESEQSIAIFILFLQLYLSNSRLIASDIRNYTTWLINQSKLIS